MAWLFASAARLNHPVACNPKKIGTRKSVKRKLSKCRAVVHTTTRTHATWLNPEITDYSHSCDQSRTNNLGYMNLTNRKVESGCLSRLLRYCRPFDDLANDDDDGDDGDDGVDDNRNGVIDGNEKEDG